MSLRDKAQEAEQEVVLAGDMEWSLYRIRSDDLTDAEEVSEPGDFPEYGEYLEADKGQDRDILYYLECPSRLAKAVVDQVAHNADLEGRWIHVKKVEKDDSDRWDFEVDVLPADVESRTDAEDQLAGEG